MNFSPHAIEKNSSQLFWILFVLQLVCWTLVPSLFQPNAPLDVMEGFAWGREWVLGTYKHPPLQAWLLEIAYTLFGTHPVGYFGLSALCTALSLLAVYRTGRLLGGKLEGLIAAALAQAILYFNFLSTEFNPNVLQLVLWAGAGYAFAHALIRRQMKYWLLLGVIFALGFYSKYSMAVLAASFGLFMLYHPEARKNLAQPGPYAAALITLVCILPHIDWLVKNNFAPFSYAASRAEKAADFQTQLFQPIKFALSQLLALLPTLIAAAVLFLPLQKKTAVWKSDRYEAALIFWLAFMPLILLLLFSLFSAEKPRDMWGMPFLSFIPLWLTTSFRIYTRFRFFSMIWGGLFLLGLAAFAGNFLFAVPYGFKPLRGQFPGKELSSTLHQRWEEAMPTSLEYVIGDAWMAGNVAFHSSNRPRPHVWIDGSEATSPWIDPQKVKTSGALLVWRINNPQDPPPPWVRSFPRTRMQKPLELRWQTRGTAPPIMVGWAWIPPTEKPH
jgi:4-amino-4-deoxy-L-arabinose transferase-like glycosyltransferase